MPVYTQKIDRAGEFCLKLEQMPIVVKPDSIAMPAVVTICLFLTLSFYFIAQATGFGRQFPVLLATFVLCSFAFYAFFYESFQLFLSQDSAEFISRGPLFVTRTAWTQPLSQYQYVAGRRYFGCFMASDTPQLIREVVLRHNQNRNYDVVLFRSVADDPNDPDLAIIWHNEWNKACMLLSLPALDIVDGCQKKIDLAQIASAQGDGGAIKVPKTHK